MLNVSVSPSSITVGINGTHTTYWWGNNVVYVVVRKEGT